jgi:CheY-like chemotaxis protein
MRSSYILIAEDDEDDQFLLTSAFKEISKEFELIFVHNGIELLEHFKKVDGGDLLTLPSLLIVDLNMPKKNGKEALEELVHRTYFSNFKTLVFSTTANDLEKKRCNEIGVRDFYVKPSNYKDLLTMVREFAAYATPPVKEI